MQLLPSPRMFKSHSPYFMMAGGEPATSSARYIYLARNPKDTAVSFYHHTKSYELLRGCDADWDGFFERFVSGEVEYGSWFEHVLQWWQHRGRNEIACSIRSDWSHYAWSVLQPVLYISCMNTLSLYITSSTKHRGFIMLYSIKVHALLIYCVTY